MKSKLLKLMSRGLMLLALTGSIFAASQNAEVKVKAGDVKATVTSAVGKTVESVRLTLTQGETVVATAETDATGSYAFKGVAEGEYGLSVAEVMKFKLSVSPSGTVSTLKIVLPEGYNAAQQKKTESLCLKSADGNSMVRISWDATNGTTGKVDGGLCFTEKKDGKTTTVKHNLSLMVTYTGGKVSDITWTQTSPQTDGNLTAGTASTVVNGRSTPITIAGGKTERDADCECEGAAWIPGGSGAAAAAAGGGAAAAGAGAAVGATGATIAGVSVATAAVVGGAVVAGAVVVDQNNNNDDDDASNP